MLAQSVMAQGADVEEAGGTDSSGDKDDKKNNKFKCRVDGCKRHLSREKTYFRRYRCCMSHSKQPAVLVEGQVRRWCQQCCCFHELGAFDGEKRNCRERLAMHNDRRNKRKNDPAAAREPSSRVAHASVPSSAPAASPMSAQQILQHHEQPYLQQSQQQQQHRSARGMSRDAGQGATALRSLSGLHTAPQGHGLRTSSCSSLQHPGKRQRLAHAPQLLQPDPASHSALVAAMLAHGGGGSGGLHPGMQMPGSLHPAALHPGLLQLGGMFHPGGGLNTAGLLSHTAPGLTGQQQAYQDALSAVAAVQSLQAQQDPVAAAAAAHRIAGSQGPSSRVAQLAGQLAAAQAAAGGNPFANAGPQLLAASTASAGSGGGEGFRAPGGEPPASAAAYLQALQAMQQQAARQQAAQQAHPGALVSQGLRTASLSAIHAAYPSQQTSAPPAMGHLMAAGRELSLNSVYSQPGACAAPRPPSTGMSGGVQQGAKSMATRRGSGLTEQLSEASMWSRRSSNTVVDAGAFLPSAAAGPMAAAAAIADSSLRTASVTTLPRSTPPPAAGVPVIKSELPGGVPFDLAAPVQGHYGAMRNAGAEGSTYLHTQLMQAHAAAKARAPAATANAAPPAAAAGPGTLPHQKAEWASIVQHAAAASGIRSALQVQASCTAGACLRITIAYISTPTLLCS